MDCLHVQMWTDCSGTSRLMHKIISIWLSIFCCPVRAAKIPSLLLQRSAIFFSENGKSMKDSSFKQCDHGRKSTEDVQLTFDLFVEVPVFRLSETFLRSIALQLF